MKFAAVVLPLAFMAALGAQTTQPPVAELSAQSVNVSEPGAPVKIRILRWSTDDERAPIVAALNPAPQQPTSAGRTGLPAEAARGRGAAEAGRGAAAGRGRGRGRGAPAAPLTPIAAFTAALGRAPTLGYIWTSDITGYSIKYAWHVSTSDGGERIVLATNRRLGEYSPAWALPPGTAPTDYEFTLIELHLGVKGAGEGKSSLTAKVAVDGDAKTVALENYTGVPAILQNVKK
jgi:hypothetical protein